nr:hypothetical protein BaRGS_026172 [Batillaria attramentaria]
MAELQNLLQTSNGAFKSDLMKVFVAGHKSDYSKSDVTGTTGAAIYPTTASTTTAAAATTTGSDTTDNANILQTQNFTDNKTSTTSNSALIMQSSDTSNINSNENDNVNHNAANTKTAPVAAPEAPDSNANVSEVHAVLEEVKGAMSDTRRVLVQQVSEATVDAHLATCINTHKAVSEATARFMAMKEAGALPDMSKLSLSASSMWEQMMAQMMPEMSKCIKFCKMLPGFTELCLDDQMTLIKQGSFEVMMTRFSMLIDHEKETMLDPSHKMCCPRKVIQETPMGKFLDGFFHVGSQFNPLELTDGEIGLFTATLIFCPSRQGLTDTKVIAKIQSLYQQALFNLMKQNHSDPEAKFGKLLGLVPMFRRINEEHSKALSSMKMQSPDGFDKQFPPLHKEMYQQNE